MLTTIIGCSLAVSTLISWAFIKGAGDIAAREEESKKHVHIHAFSDEIQANHDVFNRKNR